VGSEEGEDISKIGVPLAIVTDALIGASAALGIAAVVIGVLFTDFNGFGRNETSLAPTVVPGGAALSLSGRF